MFQKIIENSKGYEHIIIEVLRRHNVDPIIIFVFKKTGLLITGVEIAKNLTSEEVELARKAIKEYKLLEGTMSNKVQ